ncbi:unnamed protein product [Brassicogethes aeneus]|uniref:Bifunctional lysine-specific demethylase and histidyl-hydroxylase n=1 Tax=Brassicogethes aeneus TaxID=1431903 RepID=A0A9P0BD26_BRAAE|nr:unnamed protein product [Brassicogethes aeneus]
MSLNGSTPMSAFEMYKQRHVENLNVKKKKRKTKPKEVTVTSIKKQKLPECKEYVEEEEEIPQLVEVKSEKHKITEQIKTQFIVPRPPKVNQVKKIDIKQKAPINQDNKVIRESDNVNKKRKKKIKLKVKVNGHSKTNSERDSDNSVSECAKLFRWFINPIPPDVFFSEFWEKEPIHIERDTPNYYSHILTTERLDRILRDNPLYYTRNVDVVSYENGKKENFNQEGRAVAAALWDYYSNGCSIRVLNPQTYDQKVHVLISTLQEYFGTMVGTNIYLTPPGSQGFAPHYDDIEAFVVQLEGRKHWKLYRPKGPDILARDSSPNLSYENIGKPFMEVTLNAGDILYFPRGTIHEGRTDPDSHSFHITLSVYQHTAYADLLEHVLPDALKRAAFNDIEFRKGLPLNYLKHVGLVNKDKKSPRRAEIMKNVKKLISTLTNYIDIDHAADQLGKSFMHDAMPPVLSKPEVMLTSKGDGDYMKNGRVFNRVEIGLDTKIRLVRYYGLRVVKENEQVSKIYYSCDNDKVYHGEEPQWLEIDNGLIPAMEKLQSIYPDFIEVEQLPIKEDTGKVQLVADLWEKGLLMTKNPLTAFSGEEDESDSETDFPGGTIEIMEIT